MFQTKTANKIISCFALRVFRKLHSLLHIFHFLPRLHPPLNVSISRYASTQTNGFNTSLCSQWLLPFFSHLRVVAALAQGYDIVILAQGNAYVNMPRITSHVVVMPSPFFERLSAFPQLTPWQDGGNTEIHLLIKLIINKCKKYDSTIL